MRDRRPRQVVSTGAALSVPYIVAARALGIPVTYIDSATRISAPSQTGRILEVVPGVARYHQGDGWNRPRWSDFGSVFDGYAVESCQARAVDRVLVTVGSEKFPFVRALETVRDGVPDARLEWQTGNTGVDGLQLQGDVRAWWRGDEIAASAAASDVVIAHAGVGSILMVLRTGACPVVIPRLSRLGEHVDDHQMELAEQLERRGLIRVLRPGDDLARCIREASERRIVRLT